MTMSTGLYVNITDYVINFVFYLKGNTPTNVAHVLFPVQNLLEVTIYTDFIEADSSKVSNDSVRRVGRSSIYQEFLKQHDFSTMGAQKFLGPRLFRCPRSDSPKGFCYV